MKIIVGLGNPDGKYTNTYHNVGFNAVDFFAKQNNLTFSGKKCKSMIAKGEGFILAKPLTYMNLSGDAVCELKKYFKVSLNDILILQDDIDLPKGQVRFRVSGSAGTHNGMRDIVAKVGETPRIKLGIGRDERIPLKDYVLSNLDENSKQILQNSYKISADLISSFIAGDLCQNITI